MWLLLLLAYLALGSYGPVWIWRRTGRWPLHRRLAVLSLFVAFFYAPGLAVGHGVGIVPAFLVLFEGRHMMGYQGPINWISVASMAIVAVLVYLVTWILAAGRNRVLKRRAKPDS